MFKKLHKENLRNKQAPSQSRSKSKSNLKKSVSYSALQKKKQNNSDLYDYEIANFKDHIYEGCFLNNKKHGEGAIMLNSGVFMIGNWENGLLEGYALFVTPLAGKVHVNCKAGLLDGWAVLEYQNNFEIFNFCKDEQGSIRRRYNKIENLWTEALYSKKGKLDKVLRIEKTKNLQLPSFIKDETLIQFYINITEKCIPKLPLSKINITTINDRFEYYGFTDLELTPSGLGVIYSNDEVYAGNFCNGSLDKEGLILFQGGVVYKGEMFAGKILGSGGIYDINIDETKFVEVNDEGNEHVVREKQGFHLNEVPFLIGQTSKIQPDRGFSSSINELCEEIPRYFFRTSSSQSFIDAEEDSLDADSMSPSRIEEKQNEKIDYERTCPKMEKIMPRKEKISGSLPFVHKSEGEWLSYLKTVEKSEEKLRPNFPTSEAKNLINIEEKLYPNSIEEFKSSNRGNLKLIPIPEPSPIESKQKGKITYPSLLEFERRRHIGIPCSAKVGKIVPNNYLRERRDDLLEKA